MHETQFWHDRWKQNEIAFHEGAFNRHLTHFFKFAPGTVLVPLCGKTLDMLWLESQGHSVVGIELSDIACRVFFEEAGRQPTVERVGKFTRFQDGKITLWCGDFFEITPEHVGGANLYYDRAALIALPAPVRKQYVNHLQTLFPNPATLNGLLIAIHYPQNALEGPPFSLEESEIEQLYGQHFPLQQVLKGEVPKEKRNKRLAESVSLSEMVYLFGESRKP